MGNDLSYEEKTALGRPLLRDAQAIVDCFPESELSAAEKEHCYKALEEWPALSWKLVIGGFNFREGTLWLIRHHALPVKLENPNRQHGYRGRAEWPERQTTSVAAAIDSQPPESDASQSAAAAASDRGSAVLRSQPADGGHADECDALLAKKNQ